MKRAKAWALPAVTGLVVLAALLLPPQISALRDRQTLGTIHTELLAEEELTIREATLAQKLTLLVRAIRYPDLAVYSTTQPLPSPGEPEAEQAEAALLQSVDFLLAWGVLPEDFDRDSLEYLSGTRAVYVQSDGALSAGLLYLQGRAAGQDDLWLVIDQETGLPLWIDCSLRSVRDSLPSAAVLGQRFLDGLGLESRPRSDAVWELTQTDGVLYAARTERDTGRLCVEPLGVFPARDAQDTPRAQ